MNWVITDVTKNGTHWLCKDCGIEVLQRDGEWREECECEEHTKEEEV